MPPRLLFADDRTAADALVFAQRASRLGDGNVRLRAERGVLAMSCAPLAPQSLLDATPTVLGMRVVSVDPELVCDLVVAASSLEADDEPHALRLPATAVSPPWAGIAPPRTGWRPAGTLTAADLASRAQWGIADVAQRVPTSAGEEVVRALRAEVWGEPDPALGNLPLGVAFTAFALGFIGGEEQAELRHNGPWTRVSLSRGHVLCRDTVRSGLTAVRATGSAI